MPGRNRRATTNERSECCNLPFVINASAVGTSVNKNYLSGLLECRKLHNSRESHLGAFIRLRPKGFWKPLSCWSTGVQRCNEPQDVLSESWLMLTGQQPHRMVRDWVQCCSGQRVWPFLIPRKVPYLDIQEAISLPAPDAPKAHIDCLGHMVNQRGRRIARQRRAWASMYKGQG